MQTSRFTSTKNPRWTAGTVIGLLICALLLASGCGKERTKPLQFQVRGVVQGLPLDHGTIAIEHEDIPGFMPSMTMPFSARDEKEIAGLKLGDAISFRLNVTRQDSWIDQVHEIDRLSVHLPTPAPVSPSPASARSKRLREGDAMPDFTLTDQSGKQVTLETYRGHPFVLTFIFTRCPLPNFCPRMSHNFAELQKAIQESSGPLAAARLLSISFDPEHDTPQVLREYGESEGADFNIWTFATGNRAEIERLTNAFSVLVQPEQGTISHSLATALVDPRGKIEKIWRGNGWRSEEVTRELSSTP